MFSIPSSYSTWTRLSGEVGVENGGERSMRLGIIGFNEVMFHGTKESEGFENVYGNGHGFCEKRQDE